MMKTKLVGTVLVVVLSASIYLGYVNLADHTNLSEADVLEIVQSDQEIVEWVIASRATESISYEDGIWQVQFASSVSMGSIYHVEVDDKSAEIINKEILYLGSNFSFDQRIGEQDNANEEYTSAPGDSSMREGVFMDAPCEGGLYTDCGYYEEPDSEFVEQALDFVNNLEILGSQYDEAEFEFYVSSYSWDDSNTAYVYGWSYQADFAEYTYIDFVLTFEEQGEDLWSFTLDTIRSNIMFMDSNMDLEGAIALATTSGSFSNFSESVSNYTIYSQYQYNPDDGLLFDLSFYPVYDWYYRYEDNDTVVYDDPGYNDTIADGNETASDSVEYIYQWIEFIIQDSTSSIIEIWGTYSNQMSQEEVTDLALASPEIAEWVEEVGEFNTDTYYSGRGYWYVYLYGTEDYYSYAYLTINDREETVESVYSMVAVEATRTEYELRGIIHELEDLDPFFERVQDYESYYYYDHYGSWWVSYYDKDDWRNMFYLQINDSDASILHLNIWLTTPAQMTETEVKELMLEYGLQDFVDTYDNVQVYVYYDGYGSHYVYAYDMIIMDAYAWGTVADANATVLDYHEYHPSSLPEMEVDEVMEIATSNANYSAFIDKVDVSYEYIYFYGGYWYYYNWGITYDAYGNEEYHSISITIDDENGEIIDIWTY